MAKSKKERPLQKAQIDGMSEEVADESIDLLSVDFEDVAGPEKKCYTVEAAGETYELTLDELIALATRCLEVAGSAGEQQLLGDMPELLEFVRQYPDVREFPQPVAEMIAAGTPPLEAYRAFENDNLRSQLRSLEQKATNEKSSPGSARGSAGMDSDLDELMAVYNAVFR